MNKKIILEKLNNGESPFVISILKWEEIMNGFSRDDGAENCALCHLYNIGSKLSESCVGCPIHRYTKRRYCQGTPFEEFREHIDDCKECFENEVSFNYCHEALMIASKERVFNEFI